MQKDDGRWNYSFNLETGKERQQIDFHQGFILMSLYNYRKYSGVFNELIDRAIEKGIDFYFKNQFFNNGKSKWRIQKVWPVDIHNQAQGIITVSKLANLNKNYLPFAKKNANWTIENMKDERGYFYYKKYKLSMKAKFGHLLLINEL